MKVNMGRGTYLGNFFKIKFVRGSHVLSIKYSGQILVPLPLKSHVCRAFRRR